jgi:hypothetical protein
LLQQEVGQEGVVQVLAEVQQEVVQQEVVQQAVVQKAARGDVRSWQHTTGMPLHRPGANKMATRNGSQQNTS